METAQHTATSVAAVPGNADAGLRRGILLAIVYADLFDFALTHDELLRRVVSVETDRERLHQTLRRLSPHLVHDTGKFVCLRGREHLIEARTRKRARVDELWNDAYRFARWFRYIPFVRSVAVSGSLAVDNAGISSDVDFFCVTAANRLWIARLFLVPLSKLTRNASWLFPSYLCPNYILDESSLGVPDRNLYTAHEILQAVPIWGAHAHARFLAANAWTSEMLPNFRQNVELRGGPSDPGKSSSTRMLERTLSGRFGDVLNRLLHRGFVRFYRRRAVLRGWSWSKISSAYQLGRYTVPEGGYASVVGDLFRRRADEVFGGIEMSARLQSLFPSQTSEGAEHTSVHDWKGLFAQEYGTAA